MNFTRAIVRQPGRSLNHGLSTAKLGPPSYDLALIQHDAYVNALKSGGLDVTVLPADENFPDSTFVEDTALLTPKCAILMRPGAGSRRGEVETIAPTVRKFFSSAHQVVSPGTADAGDIMCVGSHYYVGASQRTNLDGARQIVEILESYGLTASVIEVGEGLHLKSSVAYLENGHVLVTTALQLHPALSSLNHILVDNDEQYAANSLWINGVVLVPSGYPKTLAKINAMGFRTIVLDTSEFRKLDGGLSCLSLRF